MHKSSTPFKSLLSSKPPPSSISFKAPPSSTPSLSDLVRQNATSRSQRAAAATTNPSSERVTIALQGRRPPPGLSTAGPVSLSQLMQQHQQQQDRGASTHDDPTTSPHPPGLSTAGPVSLSQLMQQHQQHQQQGRGASNQPLLPTTTSYNIPPPPPGFASSSSTSLSDLVKRHRDPVQTGSCVIQTDSHTTQTMSTLVNRFDTLHHHQPPSLSRPAKPVASPSRGSLFSLVIGRSTQSGKVDSHQANRKARVAREMKKRYYDGLLFDFASPSNDDIIKSRQRSTASWR